MLGKKRLQVGIFLVVLVLVIPVVLAHGEVKDTFLEQW